MYLAKDQDPKSLGDIRVLDLSGRGVLHMKDLEVFSKMTSLEKLDISDHPEFFMTEEQI